MTEEGGRGREGVAILTNQSDRWKPLGQSEGRFYYSLLRTGERAERANERAGMGHVEAGRKNCWSAQQVQRES